jgi:hypothetical protein
LSQFGKNFPWLGRQSCQSGVIHDGGQGSIKIEEQQNERRRGDSRAELIQMLK